MGLFETTEEELIEAAMRRPLEEKIEQAVALVQMWEQKALGMSDEGFYVAFSGGKDSIVMERLFRMAGVKYQGWYNNVTIDPPELVQFIKRQYPEVKWNNPAEHLIKGMVDKPKGPPTRLIRWCCEIYKEQGGNGSFKAIGVRAAESARRKGMWQQITFHRKTKDPIICPILYWTDDDVWAFIRTNGMAYCELYTTKDSSGLAVWVVLWAGRTVRSENLQDGRNTNPCGKTPFSHGGSDGRVYRGATVEPAPLKNSLHLNLYGSGGLLGKHMKAIPQIVNSGCGNGGRNHV